MAVRYGKSLLVGIAMIPIGSSLCLTRKTCAKFECGKIYAITAKQILYVEGESGENFTVSKNIFVDGGIKFSKYYTEKANQDLLLKHILDITIN